MKSPYRPPGPAVYVATLFAVAIIALLMSGLGGLLMQAGALGLFGFAVMTCLGLAALGYVSVYWWSRIDEAAQEAHKWAWWWGGTAGLAAGGVVLIILQRVLAGGGLIGARFLGRDLDTLTSGVLLIMLFQVAGYAVAWAVWWLHRR